MHCVVVDAPGEPRAVHIRPNKRAKQLADGDEEVQLYVGEGDAYVMDGKMQEGYEHSLPKKRVNKSHRFVLIFRHGDVASGMFLLLVTHICFQLLVILTRSIRFQLLMTREWPSLKWQRERR